MAFIKRTWLARIGIGLNKFIIGSPDSQGRQTLTSSPDTISQEGDVISADNLNDLEQRIENAFGEVVPKTTTVNSKALTGNITLNASDVGAVPTTRTVNGKALSSDISLTASDVGAVSAQDTGWLELYNSATYGIARYRKLNGMVTIIGDMKTNNTMGTLAEAYRPAYTISAPRMRRDGSSYYGGIVTVDTNGQVSMVGQDQGGVFCITYPV